jgi:hypothetical protein
MSFSEIVETLNRQRHNFSVKEVPKEVFAVLFPEARRRQRHSVTFRLIRTWVRIRATELRSQIRSQAADQVHDMGAGEFSGNERHLPMKRTYKAVEVSAPGVLRVVERAISGFA